MKIWVVELQDPERILDEGVHASETVVAEDYHQAAAKVMKNWSDDEKSLKLFVSSVRKIAETTID